MRFIHYAANTQLFIRSFFSEQMQRNKNFSFFNINPSFPSKEAYPIAKNNINFLCSFVSSPLNPPSPQSDPILTIRFSILDHYFILFIQLFTFRLNFKYSPLPHTSESLTFLKYNKLTI